RIEVGDAAVVGGEAAETHRGEGVTDRIEPAHAADPERHDAGGGDEGVDHPQMLHGLGGARRAPVVLHRARSHLVSVVFTSSMRPSRSSGSTATAMTMMPRPPNHCSAARQKFSDGGSSSRPLSTVEPVVVSPDIASKNAPLKERPGTASSSGNAAAADSSSQP